MIRYSRACGFYHDSLDRWLLLTRKLPNQRFLVVKFKRSLRTFYGRTMTLLTVREYLCHKWTRMCFFLCRNHNPVLSSFTTYYWVFNRVTQWVIHMEQKLLTLPEHPSSPLVFNGVRIARSLVLCVWYFVDHCLSFFFQALYCLSSIYGFWLPLWYLRSTASDYPFVILDLRLLITPLVY